jgi:hypothetical protein
MNIRTLLGHCVAAGAISLIFAASSSGADDPATPAPPTETEQLQNDVERLKAEQDRFEAKFGKLADGLAPKGEVTPMGLVVEGEILAYSTVDALATRIAAEVKDAKPTDTVVIFSEAELKLMTELSAIVEQVGLLERMRSGMSAPAPAERCAKPGEVSAAAAPIAAIANVAVAAVSLFRVDRTITGTAVTLNDFAVTAQVANQLGKLGIKVVYLPSVYDLTASRAFANIEVYRKLIELRKTIEEDLEKTDQERKALEKCAKQFDRWFNGSAGVQGSRKKLLAVVGGIIDEITKPDDSGLSRIQAYMRASQMAKLARNAWLLQIKPIAASGNVLTTKNIFYTKLRFGGGSVISYMLFNPSGELARSGTFAAYVGDKKMSEVSPALGR